MTPEIRDNPESSHWRTPPIFQAEDLGSWNQDQQKLQFGNEIFNHTFLPTKGAPAPEEIPKKGDIQASRH